MIISHSHRFIFIKSKKTGGTSVEAALSHICRDGDIVTPLGDYAHNRDNAGNWIHRAMNQGDFRQHDCALTIRDAIDPEIWKGYFKFSIARNPWDRTVSLFAWKGRNDRGGEGKKGLLKRLGGRSSEIAEMKKKFEEFVRSDSATNDCFYTIDNKLCVDFVIRYERLDEDFAMVCSRLGVQALELPRLKSGFRKDRHYSDYYNEESKAIVAERYNNDVRLFDYEFEVP